MSRLGEYIWRGSGLLWRRFPLATSRTFQTSAAVLKKKKAEGTSHDDLDSRPAPLAFDAAGMKSSLEEMLKIFNQSIKEAKSNTLNTEKLQSLSVDLGQGSSTSLSKLATIATRGNKINIVAFDPKQVKRIQTAIIAHLGMPAEAGSDSQTLSVTIPQQTEAKKSLAAQHLKDAYESLRNNSSNRFSLASVRAKYLHPLKKAASKNSGVSKDELKKHTQEIEQITKLYTTKLLELYKKNTQ